MKAQQDTGDGDVRGFVRALAAAAGAVLCGPATADVLFQQHFDLENGYSSERDTTVDLSGSADDFTVLETTTIEEVGASFVLLIEQPPLAGWEMEIREDRSGRPGPVIFSNQDGEGTDTGRDFPDFEEVYRIWDIVWTLEGVELEPGTYWLVCRAIGSDPPDEEVQRAFWLTANMDTPQGEEAHGMGDLWGMPDWEPWSNHGGETFDLTFHLIGEGGIAGSQHETARLRSIKVKDGEDAGSDIAQLRESENDRYTITSELTPRGAHRATSKIVLKNRSVHSPIALDVIVESRNTDPGGRSTVWIKDWITGKWKRLGHDPVGDADLLQRYAGLDPGRYMSPRGRIILRVRQEVTAPHGGSFETLADLVEVRVRGE